MNLNVVTILRGISGSGKSTYIKNNLDASSVVCSADHFFIDSDGATKAKVLFKDNIFTLQAFGIVPLVIFFRDGEVAHEAR